MCHHICKNVGIGVVDGSQNFPINQTLVIETSLRPSGCGSPIKERFALKGIHAGWTVFSNSWGIYTFPLLPMYNAVKLQTDGSPVKITDL